MDAMPSEPRLGYCCLFRPPLPDPAEAKRLNLSDTTISALSRMERGDAFAKMLALVARNVAALEAHMRRVAAAAPLERMLRIGSNVLPAYTHPVARWMYAEPIMHDLVEGGLARVGEIARAAGVRISMHPGPFCVLASINPSAVENGIAELEYHADLMRWMGFAGGWHPWGAHVNIHVGGAATGVEGFRAGLARLSADARGLVTVENDEMQFGLDALLPLAGSLPLVLDLHHHWVHSRGNYIQPDDPRIATVQASWRGVRPVSHISVSRENVLQGHPSDRLPDYAALAAGGASVRDLRAHSDMMWNVAVNDWVTAHLAWTDIEVEAKWKNLASQQLAEHVRRRRIEKTDRGGTMAVNSPDL